MTDERESWIVPRNWERFQHYDPDKRTPPWIKVYTSLMSDDNYLELSGNRRAILHGVWLEYARTSHARLSGNTRSLSRKLNLKVTSADLESLVHAGFLEILLAPRYQGASGALASRAPADSLEVETEKNYDVRRTEARPEADVVDEFLRTFGEMP